MAQRACRGVATCAIDLSRGAITIVRERAAKRLESRPSIRMSMMPRSARWIGWPRLLGWLAAAGVCLAGWEFAAGTAEVALRSVIPHAIPHAGPAGSPLEAQRLDPKLGDPGTTQVAGGSLDGHFTRFMPRGSHFSDPAAVAAPAAGEPGSARGCSHPRARRARRHRPVAQCVRPPFGSAARAHSHHRAAAVRRRPGHGVRTAGRARSRRAALRARHTLGSRRDRSALLSLDAGPGARARWGACPHDRNRLRRAHGDGAVDTAGALRAHRPALSTVRHAVLACRRSTSPTSRARAFTGRRCRGLRPLILLRLERAGRDQCRGGRAVRARVRQPEALLAAGSIASLAGWRWPFSDSRWQTCCGCSGSRSPSPRSAT